MAFHDESASSGDPTPDPQQAGEPHSGNIVPEGTTRDYQIAVGHGKERKVQTADGKPKWKFTPFEGESIPLPAWTPHALKALLESLTGKCRWWTALHWVPTTVQTKKGPKRQWRGEACWKFAVALVLDLDTGEHEPLTEDVIAAIMVAIESGKLPGTLVHLTPAGIRLILMLDSPIRDADVYARAWQGFALTSLRALHAAGVHKLNIDGNCVDLARLYYAPNAIAKGVQRHSQVFALREGLATSGDVAKLSSVADEQTASRQPERVRCPYHETPAGLVWMKPTNGGVVPLVISNFTGRILAEVVLDDGAESWRTYEIEGRVAGRTTTFTIPAAQLPQVTRWAATHLGAQAVVFPGFSTERHVQTAIQLLSGNPPRRFIYRQTGWRKIDGQWVYLHAGGGIGADGVVDGIQVDLPGKLQHLRLPAPPEGENLRAAIQASLSIRRIARDAVSLPLLAVAYRAAIQRCEVSPFLDGVTGAGKSELAALVQQHFGAELSRLNLPGSWNDTANALGALAFSASDSVIVLDDFLPKGTRHEISALQRKAEQVLRGQGNGQGRGRCNPDGSLRADRPPRGMVLVTGEDCPMGESLRARLLVFTLSGQLKDKTCDVEAEELTRLQKLGAEGQFASSMAGFVQWLAEEDRLQNVRKVLVDSKREWRLMRGGAHSRTPDSLAELEAGLKAFVAFALDSRAVDDTEAAVLLRDGHAALIELGKSQRDYIASADPVRKFLECLRSGLAAGRCHLVDRHTNDTPPQNAPLLGWRPDGSAGGNGTIHSAKPGGERIGWIDSDQVMLEPGAAVRVAIQLASESNDSLGASVKSLGRLLRDRGCLIHTDKERHDSKVRIGASRPRVWIIGLQHFTDDPGPSGPAPESPKQGSPRAPASTMGRGDAGPEPGPADGPNAGPDNAQSGNDSGTAEASIESGSFDEAPMAPPRERKFTIDDFPDGPSQDQKPEEH